MDYKLDDRIVINPLQNCIPISFEALRCITLTKRIFPVWFNLNQGELHEKIIVGLIALSAISGCSSVIEGTSQEIMVNTNPADAEYMLEETQLLGIYSRDLLEEEA